MRLTNQSMAQLAVISSNIRYDEPNDGPHAWSHRREFLAQRLNILAADLLATQEGQRWQIEDLASRLPDLTLVDGHREWSDTLMYPCLYYRPDVLTLAASGDIWLSESPTEAGSRSFGSAFPRLCTWARFEEDLLAINVHLDHEQPQTRVKQVLVLLEQLRTMHEEPIEVVLMGDFNEAPDGQVRAAINQNWPDLSDPWLDLELAEESSHHCFGQELDYGSRGDWILTGPSLTASHIHLDKTASADGVFPSDHFILKACLTFTPPRA